MIFLAFVGKFKLSWSPDLVLISVKSKHYNHLQNVPSARDNNNFNLVNTLENFEGDYDYIHCCGSAFVLSDPDPGGQTNGQTHKKLNFYMKNILIVENKSKNILTKVQKLF
jgi:hypothetical protein